MSNLYATTNNAENKVLFTIPFTKQFMNKLILGLILHCRAPIRGVQQVLMDNFDHKVSQGTIFNIVQSAAIKAKEINDKEALSEVRVGAHDEIYQGEKPVLVGIDPITCFTYLLSMEKNRDSTTWGTSLIDLKERGFNPQYTVADFAKGLRAGQKEALGNVPCRADVFHALQDMSRICTYMENKAYAAIRAFDIINAKMKKAKLKNNGHKLSKQLSYARLNEEKTLRIFDSLDILAKWVREDILSLTGPCYQERSELFDFILSELEKLEKDSSDGKIKKLRIKLSNGKKDLLEFAVTMDQKIQELAKRFGLYEAIIRQVFNLRSMPLDSQYRWEEEARLKGIIGDPYYFIEQELEGLARETVRASSMVENLNSRLRPFFSLRKTFKQGSLDLLQFFFNHKRFLRSKYPERVGKSPKELLTKKPHAHWLELLGDQPFKRAVA